LLLTVSGFLALVPGVVLLQWLADIDSTWLPVLLAPVALGGLVLTLAGALTADQTGPCLGWPDGSAPASANLRRFLRTT
jgi:hypothetical protein